MHIFDFVAVKSERESETETGRAKQCLTLGWRSSHWSPILLNMQKRSEGERGKSGVGEKCCRSGLRQRRLRRCRQGKRVERWLEGGAGRGSDN